MTHLKYGAATMAVAAEHLTLVDLGLDLLRSITITHHCCDVRSLGSLIQVVEFQDDRIRLPAMNARMSGKIEPDKLSGP